jgi:transposase-like protein
MSTSQRRRWRPEEKLRILEEARQADQTVSAVCRHYQIAPGQFYAWEKQARQGALEGLRNGQRGRRADPSQRLQAEIERLRAVVTELSAENLQLKKGLWP